MKRYHLHRRYREPRSPIAPLLVIVAVIALAAWGGWTLLMRSAGSDVSPQSTTIENVSTAGPFEKIIDEPLYTLELPESWQEVSRGSDPYNFVEWQNTAEGLTAQSLRIYVDNMPGEYATNRILPLRVENGLLIPGNLSENCKVFTDASAPNPTAIDIGYRVSSWEGIRFWCDRDNALRNVITTGTPEGGFFTTIAGKGGTHRYVFIYTDHTARPNTQVFVDMLKSFRVK